MTQIYCKRRPKPCGKVLVRVSVKTLIYIFIITIDPSYFCFSMFVEMYSCSVLNEDLLNKKRFTPKVSENLKSKDLIPGYLDLQSYSLIY